MEVGPWSQGPSRPCAVLRCCADVGARHLQNAAPVALITLKQGDSFGNAPSLACPLFLPAHCRGVLSLNVCQRLDCT